MRVGRDSMRVRSIPRIPNSVSAATSAPGALSSRSTTDVRSAPVRAAAARAADQDETGAGVGFVDDAVGQGRKPALVWRRARCSPRRRRARRRPAARQRHWSSPAPRRRWADARPATAAPAPRPPGTRRPCGCRPAAVPGATTMLNATSRVSSANTCSGEPVARPSRVGAPSRRSSSRSARRRSRRRRRAPRPGRPGCCRPAPPSVPSAPGTRPAAVILSSAASVKVPAGPR